MSEMNFQMIHPEQEIISKAKFKVYKSEEFRGCLICAAKLSSGEDRFCEACTKRYVRKAS